MIDENEVIDNKESEDSFEDTSLSDLLEGESENQEPASQADPDASEGSEAAGDAKPAGEENKEDPASAKGEKDEPPASKEASKEEVGFKQALYDERHKRQSLETELDQLRQSQQKQVQPEPDPPQIPDPTFEPDAYQAFQDQKFTDFEKRLVDKAASDRLDDKIFNSRKYMLKNHDDYQEMEDLFVEAAKQNPALGQAMKVSEDPAQYAYDSAMQMKVFQEVGSDADAYREKIRGELAEEVEAKIMKKLEETGVIQGSKSVANPPKSLADHTSSTPKSGSNYEEDLPISALLE